MTHGSEWDMEILLKLANPYFPSIYTVSQKKQDTKLLPITSPNVNRFSKFFSLVDSLVNLQLTHI